jgi:hypothetical protein
MELARARGPRSVAQPVVAEAGEEKGAPEDGE